MLQLLYCLTGDLHAPPMLDGLLESCVSKVKGLIEDVVWEGNLRKTAEAAQLYDAYAALSPAEQARFCLAPQTFETLAAAIDFGSSAYIRKMLDHCAEISRPDANVVEISQELVERGVGSRQMLLGGTVSVDLDSLECRRRDPTSPVFFGEFEEHEDEELAVIAAKLHRAFSRIEAASPSFARLIRNYTRVIFIRRNGTLPPSSEQVDVRLGAIGLRNVHLREYTELQLADDLIHESVHNFLGTHEFVNFPFITFGSKQDGNARPVSPWSSRPIRMTPFIHAVFVYYALLSFARLRLREQFLSSADCVIYQRRRNRYVSGFLTPGRLTQYLSGFASVDPRTIAMIDVVQDVVVSNYEEDCAEAFHQSVVARELENA